MLSKASASQSPTMTTSSRKSLLTLLLLSSVLLGHVSAWLSPAAFPRTTTTFSCPLSSLRAASRDDTEFLPLSASDLSRLTKMRERHTTMPIMILDAMLPGQCLEFGSADPKFQRLLEYVLKNHEEREIGMIGLNPHTGRPLNLGVTLAVSEKQVKVDSKGVWSIAVQGKRRFEVQGEPWMDETKSFYLADVEIVDDREEEPLDDDLQEQAETMSNLIPGLVEDWLKLVFQQEKSDVPTMRKRMEDIGTMPDEIGDRAIWVAALVNPLPALGVCVEVRPAMLACKNDFDRINLAVAAIQGSIDHLSGKRRLF